MMLPDFPRPPYGIAVLPEGPSQCEIERSYHYDQLDQISVEGWIYPFCKALLT